MAGQGKAAELDAEGNGPQVVFLPSVGAAAVQAVRGGERPARLAAEPGTPTLRCFDFWRLTQTLDKHAPQSNS